MTTASSAIYKGDIATIALLISNGELDFGGSLTPLQCAAMHGQLEIMALLLDAGADIDAVDNNGQSACHFSIYQDQFDALRFLLARGAKPQPTSAAPNVDNERIAHILLNAGALFDNPTPEDLIRLLTKSQSVPVLKFLVARNVDVSALRGKNGGTVLHEFLRYFSNTEDFVRAAVQLGGVDVNAVDHDGDAPLHCFALRNRLDLMRVLVQLGANVDQQNVRGETALLSSWGRACTRLLLTLNTDVTLATTDGKTACHFAAEYFSGFPPQGVDAVLLRMVVALGGDLDQPDNNGETPRMIAIRRHRSLPAAEEIEATRRRIDKDRLDLVRSRALEICIGLQSLEISALQLCEIMMRSFGALGSLIKFHQWWAIATTVKHFRADQQQQ